MTTISGHTTRANGTILTAAIYNADHLNHIANAVALDATKIEGATPPVVDGALVVFDGTTGTRVRTGGTSPYVTGGTDVAIADGGTGQSTAALAFAALKQNASDTVTGVVEKATIQEYWAAVADKYISADLIELASAEVTLTDAATITVDWDTFISGIVTLTANRTLGNPTNAQPGTWRSIRVLGNNATLRTLAFGVNYRGGQASLIDISTAKEYLLTLYAVTSTICILKATQAFP